MDFGDFADRGQSKAFQDHQFRAVRVERQMCQIPMIELHVYYPILSLGGVETMLVRLSRWMVDQGHRVFLHLRSPGPLDGLIDPRVHLRIGEKGPVFTRDSTNERYAGDGSRIVVFAPEPHSMMHAVRRHRHSGKHSHFLVGVYHPRIFYLATETRPLAICRQFLRDHVDDTSVLFMNEACRSRHIADFGRIFRGSPVVPPPLSDPGLRSSKVDRHRIVSVGRLVDFKTYNLFMIDVVDQLIRRGFDHLQWHVFGDGPLRTAMEAEIKRRQLQANVLLYGEVPYREFHRAIDSAGVFVGMGTAMIEAGLRGVPCAVAVESSGPLTYGTVETLPGFNCGEQQEHRPCVPMIETIQLLMSASTTEYRECASRSRIHCERFLTARVGPLFLEAALRAASLPALSPDACRLVHAHETALSVSRGALRGRLATLVKCCLPHQLQGPLRSLNRRLPQ